MKRLILFAVAIIGMACGAFGQRADIRNLDGVRNKLFFEMERDHNPVQVVNSLAYTITNNVDGIVLVRTNATVLVVIGLPNPTNNLSRKFEVSTLGASTAILTNTTYAGSFTDMFTMTNAASGYFIASNKTAIAYSTGTNYVVRLY